MRCSADHAERPDDILAAPLEQLGHLDEASVLSGELAGILGPGENRPIPVTEPPLRPGELGHDPAAQRRRAGELQSAGQKGERRFAPPVRTVEERRRHELGGVLGEAQRIGEDPERGHEQGCRADDVVAVVGDDARQCRRIATPQAP
jgi:hypothetical protein